MLPALGKDDFIELISVIRIKMKVRTGETYLYVQGVEEEYLRN
jgi:hypothetical protein